MKLIKIFLSFFLVLVCSNSFGQKQNKSKESPLYYGVYHKNFKKSHHRHHNKNFHRPGTSPVYKKEN
jgi:hypothetical protein